MNEKIRSIITMLMTTNYGGHREELFNEIVDKKTKDILEAQWIEGPPNNAEEGRYLLVYLYGYSEVPIEKVWDATKPRLKDFNGKIIKHMRLPDYD